ncbi:MAG TPA: DUF2299 family protein [Steroidobacteraceae bacterium]|nr:DUF2299 family protein [Steroidobacteraceae bacterium]
MLTKTDLATPTLIEGWLRDIAFTPIQRPDPNNNWNVEFVLSGPTPLSLRVVNTKALPRAITVVCGMATAPEHAAMFTKLPENARKEFWQQLRASLNREFVEFQIQGAAFAECPTLVQLTATRYDDGLTLDSFARTVASVIKAAFDVMFFYHERLGEVGAPAGGEFAFKKLDVQ